MPVQDIRKLLGACRELQALRHTTQRLEALQRAYIHFAPGELASASRVGYYRAATLYVIADNTAVAAKLRHMLPRLLPVVRKLEPQVTGIRIEVQVKKPSPQRTAQTKKPSLTIDNIEQFETLSQRVPDPALKSALASFARKRKTPG